MSTMQGAFGTHRRVNHWASLAVIAGLALMVGVAILASTAAPPVGPKVNPPPVPLVARQWFGGVLQTNLVAAETLPMGQLRKVFEPADLEAIAAARTEAAALAASKADEQWLDRYLRDVKSKAWAVPQPPTLTAPDGSRYQGKPLPD
jgi:hypothetical protein